VIDRGLRGTARVGCSVFTPDELNQFYARFEKQEKDPLGRLDTTDQTHKPILNKEMVVKNIRNTRSAASSGPDKIPAALLKVALQYISTPLTTLYNKAVEEEIFPSIWKTSIIKPLPKIKKPAELKDYRPVVLTSHLGKIFEGIIKESILQDLLPKYGPYSFCVLSRQIM